LIEDLSWNGTLLETPPDMRLGEYTHNIQYRASAYRQMEKNTVAAAGQLKESEMVRFYNPSGKGKRIMFVGNSITLHGAAPQIGWDREWGMAASSPENDYVHRLMQAVSEKTSDPAFCICQVAEWERQYQRGSAVHTLFENARQFQADMILLRFIEKPGEFVMKEVMREPLYVPESSTCADVFALGADSCVRGVNLTLFSLMGWRLHVMVTVAV